MLSIPFQPQFTWRKLGYLFFTDSLEYRAVLEENPQWNVTELPPLGAQLRLPSPSSTTGGLDQSSFVYGLPQDTAAEAIFPFETQEDYIKSLVRYSSKAVSMRESINGYTQDSDAAYTGVQAG
jgi:hypothetical protein